ncbi:MAG TPA: CPBP family intramembrane metalloprotease [Methanothermobacter sp.]|nr:CPBP family intramembrane metalloprotease [Methanothermobacter sp.]
MDKTSNVERTESKVEPGVMKNKTFYFLILTFSFSYLLAATYYILGGRIDNIGFMYMAILYMFIPMIIAIILQKFIYKDSLNVLGINFKVNRWWVVAWLLPLFLALLSFGISLIMPGVHFSSGMEGFIARFSGSMTSEQLELFKTQIESAPYLIFISTLIQGLIFGPTINAVAAFGEELGWRGFLQKQWSYMGFWKMSLAIGIIWGLWHAPIIIQGYNYPQNPVIGVFMMIGFCVLFTPLIVYVRIRSGSVIAAAIMHGSLNATAGLSLLFTMGGSDLTVGSTGLAGFIAMAMVNLGLLAYDRKYSKKPVM